MMLAGYHICCKHVLDARAAKHGESQRMEAECENCHKVSDHPMKDWSWVWYRGNARSKLVCPKCRRQAEARRGNTVAPARA